MDTTIFSEKGYKIVKRDDGKYYVSDPKNHPDKYTEGFTDPSIARNYITMMMKEDGVYGVGSYGNVKVVNEKWGLFLKGGSLGENIDPNSPQKVFEGDTAENDAKMTAQRRNASLTPGEKEYYKMRYSARKISNSFSNGCARAINEIANKMSALNVKISNSDGAGTGLFAGKDGWSILISATSDYTFGWQVYDPRGRKSESGVSAMSVQHAREQADQKLGMRIFT